MKKGKHFLTDWVGVFLGFLIAISTTLMSIIDFTSIASGNPFKELTMTQYVFLAISILIKGIANMFIFRSFIKNGIEKGKKEDEYQDHLDYQDEQITKCLPYRKEVDVKCDEDNYREKRSILFNYCNHNRIIFEELINDDLTLNLDYVPRTKKQAKAVKNIFKNCYINDISSAVLFDASVGGWERNKRTLLEKRIYF